MCPECGTWTGAEAGQPTGEHQKPDSRERCPGSGEAAVERD